MVHTSEIYLMHIYFSTTTFLVGLVNLMPDFQKFYNHWQHVSPIICRVLPERHVEQGERWTLQTNDSTNNRQMTCSVQWICLINTVHVFWRECITSTPEYCQCGGDVIPSSPTEQQAAASCDKMAAGNRDFIIHSQRRLRHF